MNIALTISTDVVGKATTYQYQALSDRLRPAVFTENELFEHLAVHGHPICCAALQTNSEGFCRRGLSSFVSSQVFGVDVDHGRTEFESLRDDPYLCKNALFAYTTPSHTPEHPRFRIIFVTPEAITNHEHYKKLVVEISDRFGGDKNARDAVRLWFGSPNAQTIWWGNALDAQELEAILLDNTETKAADIEHKAMATRQLTHSELEKMLSKLPRQQDYIDWKRAVSGIFNEFGADHEVFRMLEQWSPCKRGYAQEYHYRLQKVGIGTTIWLAKQHGYVLPKDMLREEPKSAEEIHDAIESYLGARGLYRFNVVRMIPEYSVDDEDFQAIDDYFVNSCLRRMRAAKIKTTASRIWEVLNSEFSEPYDPYEEYFDNLPTWDGKTDYIRELSDLLPIDDTLNMEPEAQRLRNYGILRRWFVAAVACAYENVPNHIMIILQGNQATGKTTFLRALCPPALREHHYYEGSISGERDDKINIAKAFIAIDDELESLTKRQSESIKAIITKGDDVVRLPYARAAVTVKRRTSFAGSVNRRTFLNDETGSRRYAVMPIGGRINFSALSGIKIDKCWSQAYGLWTSGERTYLDGEDTKKIEEFNREFEIKNMTDDLVDTWCVPTHDDPKALPISCTDLAQRIREKLGEKQNLIIDNRLIHQIGRSLTKGKYVKRRKMIDGIMYDGWMVRTKDAVIFARLSDEEREF
jgi:hypothetical protein